MASNNWTLEDLVNGEIKLQGNKFEDNTNNRYMPYYKFISIGQQVLEWDLGYIPFANECYFIKMVMPLIKDSLLGNDYSTYTYTSDSMITTFLCLGTNAYDYIKVGEYGRIAPKFKAWQTTYNGITGDIFVKQNDNTYLRIEYEQVQSGEFTFIKSTAPSTLTFRPYEEIDLSGISVSVTKVNVTKVSSKECVIASNEETTYTTWDDIKANAISVESDLPSNNYFDETYVNKDYTIRVKYKTDDYNSNGILEWKIHISDFENKVYEVKKKENASYDIYVGKEVGNAFLNAFQVIANYQNGGVTKYSQVVASVIEKAKMSSIVPNENNFDYAKGASFDFNYSYDNQVVAVSVKDNLHLLHNLNKFNQIKLKVVYKAGELLNLDDIISNVKTTAKLTYDDNTTISLNDSRFNVTISCSLSGGKLIEITEDTLKSFTISLNFSNATYFKDIVDVVNCSVQGYTEDFVDHCTLLSASENFKYGDTISIGEDAVLVLYNHDNDEIGRLTYSQIGQAEEVTLDTNNFYNKRIDVNLLSQLHSTYGKDTPITFINYYNAKEFRHTINVSYPESFSIDYSEVTNPMYFNKNCTNCNIDLANLKGTITYQNNENGTHKTEQKDVSGSLTTSYTPIDTRLDYKQYTISVSTSYLGRAFNKSFNVDVYMRKPIRLVLNDNEPYYDNDSEVMRLPSGTIYFNDSTNEEFNSKNHQVNFYRDNAHTLPLTIGESVIRSIDGNVIYYECVDNVSATTSSYSITFKDDKVSTIEIANECEFTLGNKYNALFNTIQLKVTYESGKNENTSFTDYDFVIAQPLDLVSEEESNPYIIEPLESITITTYDCYKSLSKQNTLRTFNKQEVLGVSKITFKYPKVKNVECNYSKFVTYYNNGVGKINVTPITFKVYYENADYVQVVDTYVKQKSENANEFSVSAVSADGHNTTIAELQEYNFDGSELVQLSLLDSEVEKSVNLIFTFTSVFSDETSKIDDITKLIKVIEITDIIGIALVPNTVYQNYSIGETFLNELDTTEVTLYYQNANGERARLNIRLKDGFPSINILPLKGTMFNSSSNAISVRITSAMNSNVSLEYTINVTPNYVLETTTEQKTLRVVKGIYNAFDKNTERYYIVDDSVTEVIDGVRQLSSKLTLNDASVAVYGYLDDLFDTNKNARVIFFNDYLPPIDGESNISIKFPCYLSCNSDYINKCHFGHLFGNNNAKNRLFLSGNPDYINCDWHSGAVNTDKQSGDKMNENGDFTYFEDTSYCFYGQTDNAIVGYDIISNDRMVVLKSKSAKEPTIYYRTNGLIQAIDGSGNNQYGINNETLYAESYPLVIGNIGAGALSNRSIINFNGDTLFLSSDNEVDGLDVTGIIGDSQRYAYTRSLFINPYLKQYDLKQAQFFTNNKYLYLVLDDCIFVTYFEKYDSDTRQYEWFKLDIKDVSYIIEVNDKLYFATNGGKIYALENGIYSDMQRIFVSAGSFSNKVNVDSDTIVASQDLINKLDENEDYRMKIVPNANDYKSYMYYQVGTISNVLPNDNETNVDLYINVEENCLEVVGIVNGEENIERKEELARAIKDDGNVTYYINFNDTMQDLVIGSKGFDNGIGYKLKVFYNDKISTNEKFKIYDAETDKELNAKEIIRGTLCLRMDGEYYIRNIDKENCTFELHDDIGKVDVIQYDRQSIMQSNQAIITRYDKINAYYIKAPNTFGNLMYNKTIWSWTITNDTNLQSNVEVCYASNDIDFSSMSKIVDLTKMESGLNLEDIKKLADLYKTLSSDSMKVVRQAFNEKYGFNLDDISVDKINFSRFIIPHKYTFYRPLNAPFICFGFKNVAGQNAVLCTMQVLYSIPLGSIGK